jgi:hypothetical protein
MECFLYKGIKKPTTLGSELATYAQEGTSWPARAAVVRSWSKYPIQRDSQNRTTPSREFWNGGRKQVRRESSGLYNLLSTMMSISSTDTRYRSICRQNVFITLNNSFLDPTIPVRLRLCVNDTLSYSYDGSNAFKGIRRSYCSFFGFTYRPPSSSR